MNPVTSPSLRATDTGCAQPLGGRCAATRRRLTGRRWRRISFAAAGTCTYVAISILPGGANVSLALLAVASVLAAAFDHRPAARDNRLLAALVAFGLSTLV